LWGCPEFSYEFLSIDIPRLVLSWRRPRCWIARGTTLLALLLLVDYSHLRSSSSCPPLVPVNPRWVASPHPFSFRPLLFQHYLLAEGADGRVILVTPEDRSNQCLWGQIFTHLHPQYISLVLPTPGKLLLCAAPCPPSSCSDGIWTLSLLLCVAGILQTPRVRLVSGSS
jgi:hypothetical protein